jgi:creatinine amidohydrolase/Fe(II)-dependent formamide hydrolase-like protein
MMKLEELSSSELRRVVESGVATAVVPFGSVEGHGGRLPLGGDTLLADFVGEAVADGARSGKWLTSVMLVVRTDLVDVESAGAVIKDEARTATAERGADSLERFVSAMVETARDHALPLGSGGSRSGPLPE